MIGKLFLDFIALKYSIKGAGNRKKERYCNTRVYCVIQRRIRGSFLALLQGKLCGLTIYARCVCVDMG